MSGVYEKINRSGMMFLKDRDQHDQTKQDYRENKPHEKITERARDRGGGGEGDFNTYFEVEWFFTFWLSSESKDEDHFQQCEKDEAKNRKNFLIGQTMTGKDLQWAKNESIDN